MPRRRLVRRLCAVVGGSLAGLVAAELAYRWTRVDGLSPTTHPGYVRHDPELGWSYIAGARARHRSAEFDVAVAINAAGFRGPEWPAARDGRPLVLLVGDSMVFGWGVEEPDTLAGQLRQRHPQWDVRSVGVSGYAPDQQLLLLRRLRLAPDAIVCVSCSNDAYEAPSDFVYGLRKPRFDGAPTLRLVSQPGPESFLHAHSLLFRALVKLAWRWQFTKTPVPDDWELVQRVYRTMRGEHASAAFVLVGDEDALRGLAESLPQTTYLPLGEVLPGGGDWIFPLDTHWNAAGHRRVAEAVGTALGRAFAARGR